MSTDKPQRLRPWLEDMVNSGKIPGLSWVDEDKTTFRVSWKHAGKPDFNVDQDAVLFRKWAEHTGKYRSGESPDPSTWKTRFRCALHKMPDIEEVRIPRSLDGDSPYRVFQFKPRGSTSSSRESTCTPSSSSPATSAMRGHATPAHESPSFNGRNQPASFTSYLSGPVPSSEGAFDPASDDSYEELDAIIPTFPEQISPPNSVDKYYSGCTGFVEAQMRTLQQGDANMYFDSAFYSYTRLPTQQALPSSWMKFLVGTGNSEHAHMNGFPQQNGYSEMTPSEMPLGLYPDPFQCEVDLDNGYTAVEDQYCKSYVNTAAHECIMEIKIFYDRKEVYNREITRQESDQAVRLSTAAPEQLSPPYKHLNYGNPQYNAYYGPMNATQVVLPVPETCISNETRTVLENMKRGLILHMTGDGDVYASRLCRSRVFHTNGTEEATKLDRDGKIKVFDYQRFLPKLRMSNSGNCCPPSYDSTFNLGRADGSLVAIVVTHSLAKKEVDKMFCSVEKFVSEPNPDDQMLEGEEMEP